MLREAAGRYVALDGRMWRTLIGLLFRPGFLTREYFAGRRRRYIRPARLFLVLSIALFALLRFTSTPPPFVDRDLSQAVRDEIAKEDTDAGEGVGFSIDPDLSVHVDIGSGTWFAPARRLLMWLVYAGRARRYPARPRRYAAHLVFGAHNHAFLFLVTALIALLPFATLRDALTIWAIVYLLRSMKTVYGGRWSGVFARALVILVVYSLFFAVVICGLVFAAIMLR